MLPKHIKQVQARSRKLEARVISPYSVIVDSGSEPPGRYAVSVRYQGGQIRTTCTCSWSSHSGVACSHVMAALEALASRRGRTLSYWLTEDEARRQRHRRFFLTRGGMQGGVWITSRPA
jgi:hypothetical protein